MKMGKAMKTNISFGRIVFLLLLSAFIFNLSAYAQDRQISVSDRGQKSDHVILAQHGYGWGNNLQPPVVSIESCANLENISPNSPGPPRCLGRGGPGWGAAPMILVHFRGLTMGEHTLHIYPQGVNREGKTQNFKKRELRFSNNTTGYWQWFQSPIIVGKHCSTCWLTLCLDGPNNLVGGIEFSGSFE